MLVQPHIGPAKLPRCGGRAANQVYSSQLRESVQPAHVESTKVGYQYWIVLFLMSFEHPSKEIMTSVKSAVKWFEKSRIFGIRVKTLRAQKKEYGYHTTSIDRVVVEEPKAPPIWARFYEPGTDRPLFGNRDGKPKYSLAEVDRERRTGYVWYTYAPQKVLENYPAWKKRAE
jgi:PelA/Pel-15E family pectate lyase